jgi:hypothetical protein
MLYKISCVNLVEHEQTGEICLQKLKILFANVSLFNL